MLKPNISQIAREMYGDSKKESTVRALLNKKYEDVSF